MSEEQEYVCADCIKDADLKKLINKEERNEGHCSFCGKESKVISIDELSKKIKKCIDLFFEKADNIVVSRIPSKIFEITEKKALDLSSWNEIGKDYDNFIKNEIFCKISFFLCLFLLLDKT